MVSVDKDGLWIVQPTDTSTAAFQSKGLKPLLTGTGDPQIDPNESSYIGVRPASVGGSLNIVIDKSPALAGNTAASAAFDRAAQYVESLFDDPITVYIDADFTTSLPSGALEGTAPERVGVSYSNLRSQLVSDASSSESIVRASKNAHFSGL